MFPNWHIRMISEGSWDTEDWRTPTHTQQKYNNVLVGLYLKCTVNWERWWWFQPCTFFQTS